eukprot:7776552-Pyramimonas_sp.AAC.1
MLLIKSCVVSQRRRRFSVWVNKATCELPESTITRLIQLQTTLELTGVDYFVASDEEVAAEHADACKRLTLPSSTPSDELMTGPQLVRKEGCPH